MNRPIEYRGYVIRTEFNKKDKNYPFIAVARKGSEELKKRGYDEQQAVDLVTSEIDFILAIQAKNKE